MQWSESEKNLIGQLEAELGSTELSAVLSEWVTATVHRILAVSVALACWRDQLIEQGWSTETIDGSLPMILDRLWQPPAPSPIPLDQLLDLISIHYDHDDDGTEED